MRHDHETSTAQKREHADPSEINRPIPIIVILLALALFVWAIFYIVIRRPSDNPAFGDNRARSELMAATAGGSGGRVDGAQVFAANCIACHQANAMGLPGVFPPLALSQRATAKATLPISIVLHGISGKLTTSSGVFNGSMPTFKAKLSDAEIAAVLTHVRTNFGNAAGPVSAAEVKAVRDQTKDRTTPWTGDDELAKIKQ
ncbi:Cytochrome c, mono-and diheme variants [Collimonas sp. OK307]|uniref:c-type cytochrome n=1 Tax=Collimonas sp. OK307 TaxID=1801620 RepID=UPI0008EB4F9B|nr:cytochrome c [Collimonas sp. OK307]SFI32531.1 Cytochrome c, mono-and diheme variants [Collimonas sp. OK307]